MIDESETSDHEDESFPRMYPDYLIVKNKSKFIYVNLRICIIFKFFHFLASPVIDGEFFPEIQMLYRPSSRTGDYSTIKRNSSSKQLMRFMSNDESGDATINRYPLRNSRSTYIDK